MGELDSLLGFARGYAALGSAVQEQLNDIVETGDMEQLEADGQLNANAVKMIRDFLGEHTVDEEVGLIVEEIDAWLASGEFDGLGFRQ